MNSFGIMVLNRQQEPSYYREIGKHGEKYGFTVHRFIPTSIDPYTEKVSGETFDPKAGEWAPETFSIPDLLYDRCFYGTRMAYKTNAPIVEWLKQRATFLGFGLPNKWKQYQVLKNDPYLRHYTIDSIKGEESKQIMEELGSRPIVLLKPESGSQGKGILLVKRSGDHAIVLTERQGRIWQKTFSSQAELKNWLDARLKQTSFLIQPFLPLRDRKKRPFDIRVLVHKNEHGYWKEYGRGIRFGKPGGLVSNLHNTGTVADFDKWLGNVSVQNKGMIVDELDGIISRVPVLLERAFGPLFELGLDIGMDANGAIWILEANSKPGHQTVLRSDGHRRSRYGEAPLEYGRHLLKEKELNGDAATASFTEN